MMILAADIGGTHTRLLLQVQDNGHSDTLIEKSYLSSQYAGLVEVVKTFLTETNIKNTIDAACFAAAGPVKSGEVAVTNLPWVLSEQQLADELNIPHVKIINDFTAAAYGVLDVKDEDIEVLQPGIKAASQSPADAVVIGAGTGLGAAHIIWLGDGYRVCSSEAGHAGFAAESPLQCELLSWMQASSSHVSLETFLSGSGLFRIYQFLKQIKKIPESDSIKKSIKDNDPAQMISQAALSGSDYLCQMTLNLFIEIYGAAAGNIALHYYPLSEVYIAGGIAAKIKPALSTERFIQAFINKGPMTANMEALRVKLVCNENIGLYGALSQARAMLISL